MTETYLYNDIKFSCLFSRSRAELRDLVKHPDFLVKFVEFNVRQMFPILYSHVENIVKDIARI